MTTYYVDQATGNDTNDGSSWATAFRTIDKAMFNANGGYNYASIFIKSGLYTITHAVDFDQGGVIPSLIGVGFVIIRVLDPAYRLDLRNRYHATYSFHNIHFKPHTFKYTASTGNAADYYIESFYGCGLYNQAIDIENTVTINGCGFSRCHFEGSALPPYDTDFTTDIGPFHLYPGAQGRLKSDNTNFHVKNAFNCSISSFGFVIQSNDDLSVGFSLGTPDKVQTDILDASNFIDSDTQPNGTLFQFDSSQKQTLPFYRRFDWWKADPATASNGTVSVEGAETDILLTSGDNVAVLSPVYYYSLGISLSQCLIEAVEFSDGGEFQGLDSSPTTTARTIEYRISDTAFFQADTSPAWVEWERGTTLPAGVAEGKYVQFRVTFTVTATLT